jgi:dTDP-N-acetylfucosamine:lipid II N-acetylfucosaminyltransferase
MDRKKFLVHIFNDDLFYADKFISLLENELSENFEHLYYFTCEGKNLRPTTLKKNLVILTSPFYQISTYFNFLKNLWIADKVIFHGLRVTKVILPMLTLIPSLRKRSYWVIWGSDLYFYELRKQSLVYYLYFLYRAFFIRLIPNIISFIKGDYELAIKWYHSKAEYHQAFYQFPVDFEMLALQGKLSKNGSLKNILLGNSASPSNEHMEVLSWLKELNTYDSINVICPLSYGNEDYKNQLSDFGKKILGDRFKPLFELLSPSEYAGLLSTIDIAIMNYREQAGAGTIIPLLYLGKTVCIRKSTTPYKLLTNLGVKVFDTVELLNAHKLPELSPNEAMKNREIIYRQFSNNSFIELWRKIFAG